MRQFLITVLVLLIVGAGGYYMKYGSPVARTGGSGPAEGRQARRRK